MQMKEGHIALHVLYDLVFGIAALQEEGRVHYEDCEACQGESKWLSEMRDFGTRERSYDPAEWAVATTVKMFKLKKPRSVRFAEEVVAALMYDSFNEPLPEGVRRRDLPARQALYQAAGLQLDLKIQLFGEDQGAIMGQVVSERGDVSVDKLEVALTEDDAVVSTSRTNALGEFIFEGVPRGNYEVKIYFADKTFSLPPLPMGNC